ncbi:MAG: hypothetical protein ACE5RE_04475 [Candidatus Nitrosomaritimum aestuariumsis]|jgi:hypothetical protein
MVARLAALKILEISKWKKMMMVFLFGKNNAIIVKNSGMLNECYLLVPKILF